MVPGPALPPLKVSGLFYGLDPTPSGCDHAETVQGPLAVTELTEKDWREAADAIGCEVAAIKAVAKVESPRGAFLPSGEPSLLFERHKFSGHTGHRFDRSHSDISNPKPGGYGTYAEQHQRMQKAADLDRKAALMSASWGRFQILGENYEQAGFASLQDFVNAMYANERAQLKAFVAFILGDPRLAKSIRHKEWSDFARVYNGPAFKKYSYDTKLAAAYTELAA